MLVRQLTALAESEGAKARPYLNTGGPLDITNGKFIAREDGGWALSGGLGLTTAAIAKANQFKSTMLNGASINAMARFPGSQFILDDSEYATININRLANMSDLHLDDPEKRAAHITDMESRITVYDPTTDQASSLDAFVDFMKEIQHEKVKCYKDYEVETEVLDPDSGKPYRMLLPTFMGVDSWTEAVVKQLNVKNDEFTADTDASKMRTIWMEEGAQKTRLMRQLPSICAKAGIYFTMTGHLGKKFSIDGKPTSKDMVYMSQDETVKSLGDKFYFLMSTVFKITGTSPIVDANNKKLTDYPSSRHIGGSELQEINVTQIRSKNAGSGQSTQLAASQSTGVMTGLSYYNYLRNNKYFGLGSPNKVRNPLLGDLNLGRTKIFDLSTSYEVQRALELTYQLFVIQSTWTLVGQPVDYSISIEKFAEELCSNKSYAISDILNTRGWWTYKGAAGIDRSLLTLPDVLNIISGNYKPKLISFSTAAK